ncbi:MAG: hypothetical protein GY925_00220 [Actinomycetia bacterium]|nr:hypothetical protein [Actinomycetes bacterium]
MSRLSDGCPTPSVRFRVRETNTNSDRAAKKTTVAALEEFEAEPRKATDLATTAKRFTQSHPGLVVACADFADGPVWITDGAPSPPHWLTEHTDHCANTVREWIRVGRALRAPRASAEAFRKGELLYSKVRALTRIAT